MLMTPLLVATALIMVTAAAVQRDQRKRGKHATIGILLCILFVAPWAAGTKLHAWRVFLPVGVLLLIPAIIFWRGDLIARRRSRSGRCLRCGYDRRGIPAASVCPECGAAPNEGIGNVSV